MIVTMQIILRVKFGAPLDQVCKPDLPGPLLVSTTIFITFQTSKGPLETIILFVQSAKALMSSELCNLCNFLTYLGYTCTGQGPQLHKELLSNS